MLEIEGRTDASCAPFTHHTQMLDRNRRQNEGHANDGAKYPRADSFC
eukprot:COSAG03_NODE_19076_length_343_cov_0.635246_1_plen_46_part_01